MAYESWTVEWDMPTLAQDRFRRTTSGGWGRAPGALLYTNTGGSPSEHYVDGSRGIMSLGSLDTLYVAQLPIIARDVDITGTVQGSVTPSGAGFEFGIRARVTGGGDFVDMRLFPGTGGTVSIAVRQFLGGAETVTGFPTVAGITPTTRIGYHLQVIGDVLRARAWDADTAEPEAWDVSMATAHLGSGAAYLTAILAALVSNPLPVPFAWDDLLITTPERWMDVTSYVDTAQGPFSATSGDTPEASADTGGAGLPFLNADQRFTPGNINSPYSPNIRPGRRIRVRETIADQVFARFAGYIQYPEIAAWTQSTGDSPRDQQIGIPVVDRAAWIAQGRKLIGTLAEHIIYHGGTALRAYWPLNEQALPLETVETDRWRLGTQTTLSGAGSHPNDPPLPSITFAGGAAAPGDDTPGVDFQPSRDTTIPVVGETFELVGFRDTVLTVGAGQVCTLVAWINPDEQMAGINSPVMVWLNYLDANEDPILPDVLSAAIGVNAGLLYGSASSTDWGASATGGPVPFDIAIPVAVRFGFNPAVIELWVGATVYTNTMTVTTPNPKLVNHMRIGRSFDGSVSDVQVYIGAESDWTHDDFLAQHQWGLLGGDRQSTGERIRTILQFAGVDPAELEGIDNGASVMQPARLAGRGPMDLIAEAVETEQGELYADGAGLFQFADRIRLYNI